MKHAAVNDWPPQPAKSKGFEKVLCANKSHRAVAGGHPGLAPSFDLCAMFEGYDFDKLLPFLNAVINQIVPADEF